MRIPLHARHLRVAVAVLGTALGALSAAGAPSGEEELQRTASALGARFIEGVNSEDAALRGRVIRETFPAALESDGEDKVRALFDRLHGRYGALAFHHAEAVWGGEGPDSRLALHVYARSAADGGWKDFQFWLDPAPPHRIRSIVFVADVAEPVYLPNGDITDAATLRWLAGYIDKLVAEEDLAGGLMIAQGDRVLFERWFGHADSARRRPIAPATRFNLGSGGKMWTALAIAALVEEGRLRFDDTLARVLPEVRDQAFARSVTIGHLLSHTAGVGEFWNDDYERHWHELRTLKQFLPFVLEAGIQFPAGERFAYSNSNYILAGLVLEAVTGRSYDEVIDERILRPLGMRDSGLFPFDDRDSLQAQRLTGKKGAWRTTPHGYRGSSAGGALSTGADLLRFTRGLVGGRIVSDSMLAELTASKTTGLPGSPEPYGYGFILQRTRGGVRSFGHGGIAAGVNFELRHFPDSDITLIVFSNQDNGAYDDLRRNSIKLITGER